MNLEKIIEDAFGTPFKKQQEFFSAKTRYVGYGGARGGGKSHGVRYKATLLALDNPGIKILIIRKTFADLTRLYVRPLQSAYAIFPSDIRPKYSSEGKIFTFPANGATIEMAYCANDSDANNYRGLEWDVIFLDEATDYSEYAYGILSSCVRGANKQIKRLYVTCNPGGVGHTNIKRLFIKGEYRKKEKAKDYTFIQAYIWDNIPLLMSDDGFKEELAHYRRTHRGCKVDESVIKKCMYASNDVRVLANMPKDMMEAYLNGDWDVFSGQYFPEWDEDVHITTEESVLAELKKKGYDGKDFPSWWRRTAAIDYGLDCFAVIWVAVDEHGRAYVYRNSEESDLPVEFAVAKFKRLTGLERIEAIYAPPDLWNRHSDTGKSTADIFAANGLPLIQASNARESGWLNVKEYIKKSDGQGNTAGYPKMLFLEGLPINKHMPVLQHDEKKVNDVATEPHDITHSPDALRYWCSMRQLGTTKPVEKQPDPWGINKPQTNVINSYLMGGYQ